jgi:tetratricopeptide (TPR) repeat protein
MMSVLVRTKGDDSHAGEDEVVAVRESVQRLVALDVVNGGDQTSILATQTLRAAEPMLAPGAYDPKAERELRAAVAELAEVTGWLLCDANRHSESLIRNRQALSLARLAGDRSMELFVIHNLSLQATYLRQPKRSMELIRPILDQCRLTPRLSAMFQLRAARAYAQMGLRHMAIKTLDTAIGLFYEGTSERDPAWSWWISERGFDHATGAMLGSLGDWKAAIDPLHRALDAAPDDACRDRFLYMCVLLHAQIRVGAWRDAAAIAEQLSRYIAQVRSSRPLARLLATITGPPTVAQGPGMDGSVAAINNALDRSSSMAPGVTARR